MSDDLRRRLYLTQRLLERSRKQLWFGPSLMLALALILFLMTYLVDLLFVQSPELENPLLNALFFTGDASSARSVLAAIAGAWTTIMGVVFSITMVVLQLASSKYTSQLIPRFEQDRITQVTLGSYLGTVAYALLLLRSVRDGTEGGAGFVPFIGINLTLAWALFSLALTVAFIAHLSNRMQPISLIRGITQDGIEALAALTASTDKEWIATVEDDQGTSGLGEAPQTIVSADSRGYIQALAWGPLFSIVREELEGIQGEPRFHIELRKTIDDPINQGDTLARLTGERAPDESVERLARWIKTLYRIDPERSIAYDPSYAIDELVNIGIKTLSTADVDVTSEALRGLTRFYLAQTQRKRPETLLEIIEGEGRARFDLRYPDIEGQLLLALTRLYMRAHGQGHLTVLDTFYWESGGLIDQLLICHQVAAGREEEGADTPAPSTARCTDAEAPDQIEASFQKLLARLEVLYTDSFAKPVAPSEIARLTRHWIDATRESVALGAPLAPRWLDFLTARYEQLKAKGAGDTEAVARALSALLDQQGQRV